MGHDATGLRRRRSKGSTDLPSGVTLTTTCICWRRNHRKSNTVLRARREWQRFQANRRMYDAIYDWHTLEGPFVRRHNNKYYCFYSGGRWEIHTLKPWRRG